MNKLAARLPLDRLVRLADCLAVALAVSLPWSTSATGILAVLWLLAVLPTLDVASVRRELSTPAGGLPVLLWALAVAGMLWTDASWAERLDGLNSFHKLLFIPLLLAQFRRSGRGAWVLTGFLVSCAALLAVSWIFWLLPAPPWPVKEFAIPVKDRIAQGSFFTVCIFLLLEIAREAWRGGRRLVAAALGVLAFAFLANVLNIAVSRTAFVTIVVLLLLFGLTRFNWKGLLGVLGVAAVLAGAVWSTAPHLRHRVTTLIDEVRDYRPDAVSTSAGERIEFWRKSVEFVAAAPVIGHGTGSIREQFRKSAVGQTGMAALASSNPHNQVLAVAIQLGLVGTAVLLAMWVAHLLLFRGPGMAAWVGLVVVVQNVVGSLFNAHLFDFAQGWGYVVGLGVAGGIALRNAARDQVPL